MSYYPSHTTLKCFEQSAQRLSFTQAARRLHLTQGAVSHHILKLEAQLGASLFIRENGGLRLTSAGERYLHQIAPALQLIEQATDDLRRQRGAPDTLRISTPPTFADYWLISRLNQFTLEHPEIRLMFSIKSGNAEHTDADLSFALTKAPAPGVQAMKILSLVYRPYMAPGRLRAFLPARRGAGPLPRAALKAVLAGNLLLRTAASSAWEGWLRQKDLLPAVKEAQLHGGPAYATASLAMQAAIDGVGIALLPDYVLNKNRQGEALACLDPDGWQSDQAYYMSWARAPGPDGPLRTLIDWLQRQVETGA